MSKPGLSFGLNMTKKSGPTKPVPPKRKPMFGGEDDSDDDNSNVSQATKGTAILELDDDSFSSSKPTSITSTTKASQRSKNAIPSQPPQLNKSKKNSQISQYGDLSSALESRKYQEAAESLDPSVYDYDGVYDSMKPSTSKPVSVEDAERRPKYMKSLLASAQVRKRDALIAEEKKIARERELEGEEFADKDKFVTEAYKKQQEENRRLEAEEKKREEEEAEKNKGGGMTAFYKDLLERGDKRHMEAVAAVEERKKEGPSKQDDEQGDKEKQESRTDADLAREMNSKGAGIAINEDGQVVDHRDLLKGGLNLGTIKKPEIKKGDDRGRDSRDEKYQSQGKFAPGGKHAMRERQTRMLEAQLEQSLKRSMQEEEEEREKVERASKSRKTDSEISSAKERYLARKRAAEEAKKQGS